MAAVRKFGSQVLRTHPRATAHRVTNSQRTSNLSLFRPPTKNSNFWRPLLVGVSGSVVGVYIANNIFSFQSHVVDAHVEEVKGSKEDSAEKNEFSDLSRRQKRFHDFASCEVSGQMVMTPYDFIESLVEDKPKLTRRAKIHLTPTDIERIVTRTPPLEEGSKSFFRNLHQDGIITYSEYLFLVTVLTKSTLGLKTALKMMDANGDERITIEEFRLLEDMINKKATDSCCFKHDERQEIRHTTLYLHLFGQDGKRIVSYDEFFNFMDDMQMEVLELEFFEYSKGLNVISEVDFAKILLRNTILTKFEHEEYLDRLRSQITTPRGISLDEFEAFNDFLNDIEDFIVAVNMTKLSPGEELDKKFFRRAVAVVTGKEINPYVVDVVFALFDEDGNGKLSPQEFIAIMKDRLKRGFGKFPSIKGWKGFKHCLKKEIIKSTEKK